MQDDSDECSINVHLLERGRGTVGRASKLGIRLKEKEKMMLRILFETTSSIYFIILTGCRRRIWVQGRSLARPLQQLLRRQLDAQRVRARDDVTRMRKRRQTWRQRRGQRRLPADVRARQSRRILEEESRVQADQSSWGSFHHRIFTRRTSGLLRCLDETQCT